MDDYNNPNSNNRKVTVSCRVLPEQKLLIAEKANNMGMLTSQYLEAKVLREDTFSLEDKIEKQRHEIQSLKSQFHKTNQGLQEMKKLKQDYAKLNQYNDELIEILKKMEAVLEENERLRNKIDELKQEEEFKEVEVNQKEEETFNFPKLKWWMISIPVGLILLIYLISGRTGQQNTVAVVQPANPPGNFLQ